MQVIDKVEGQWQLQTKKKTNKEASVNRKQKQTRSFYVLCSWCGVKIRDDKEHDTTGVCLKCFYQILSNHLRSQKIVAYGEFVSDR